MFFGGRLFYTNRTFSELKECTPGLGIKNKSQLLKRLELTNSIGVNKTDVIAFKSLYKVNLIPFLNNYYSQINSVNNQVNNLILLNITRLYLTKTYRGKCHLLGKPTNGQRSWSNGWTSYKCNTTLRKFVTETRLKLAKTKKVEKINYKLIKKKYGTKNIRKRKLIKKQLLWL